MSAPNAGKLFGASILRCPGKSSLARYRIIFSGRTFGQTKVDNFRVNDPVSFQADHDVAGLNVAMDQVLFLNSF
jgi:hypothetical protein